MRSHQELKDAMMKLVDESGVPRGDVAALMGADKNYYPHIKIGEDQDVRLELGRALYPILQEYSQLK